MKTGFIEIDKIVDLDNAGLILLAGTYHFKNESNILLLNILNNIIVGQNSPALILDFVNSNRSIKNKLLSMIAKIDIGRINSYYICKKAKELGYEVKKDVGDFYCIRKNPNKRKPRRFGSYAYESIDGDHILDLDNCAAMPITNKDLKRILQARQKLKIRDKNLYIYNDELSIQEIEQKCRKLVNDKNIKIIMINNLQSIRLDKKDTLRLVCERLSKLSKELNVPILLNSQPKQNRPMSGMLEIKRHIDTLITLNVIREKGAFNPASILEVSIDKNKNNKIGKSDLLCVQRYCIVANLSIL